MFVHEDFRKAETAAGKLAGIVIADQGDPFLADFGQENFPSFLRKDLRAHRIS